jgi:hypothetical protein
MYFHLILPIAIFLTVLAACFAALLWRLATRFDVRYCTAEWLDGFSLESYAPMERLLGKDDAAFLASQPGYHPKILRRLMAERRRIFIAYLEHLVRDFNQLIRVGKLMIVYSTQDRQDFARLLWRQQVRFYVGVYLVRVQVAIYPLGWSGSLGWSGQAEAHRLVAALAALRNQVVELSSPSQAQFDIA